MKSKTMIILALGALVLCACEDVKKGLYKSVGQAHFESITIKSGGKAEMVFMGSPAEVEYTVEDGKVKLTTAGQTQLLIITKDGCLDGGGFMGKYCIE
ncbi:hypothetical protein MWU78_18430 [Arenibacter sp. F26102]|uniref:hypothetical protein n=1 Tax=Arenibacter sp. F26102 TaxID=2926416 RepID=UPI001FF26243|nr:hypothetical protein [Arenibacter sp. F26102]MCK0147638.1 hypothetical protein [Arenibacter sp. F26102]